MFPSKRVQRKVHAYAITLKALGIISNDELKKMTTNNTAMEKEL
ncbi:MAG: hypothetical protein ACQEUT_19120 [Bacillota bacterium]